MIDFAAIPTYLDDLMNGLWVTLALTGLTMFFGILIAVPIALARNSDNPILKSVGNPPWPSRAGRSLRPPPFARGARDLPA